MLPPIKFEGHKVRVAADGQVSILDAMTAVGIKDARNAWRRVQKDNPEFVELAQQISFGRGRPTPVADEEGIYQILMALSTRYLDDEGRAMIQGFRAWLANTAARVRRADPTLAAEIIDRQTDPAKLEWLSRRAENKGAALSLNAGIQRHGGSKRVYSKVHDTLNVAVTGQTARQIQRRGSRVTKDNLSVEELTLSTMSQMAAVSGMAQRGAYGDGQILEVAGEVGQDIAAFRRKWLGGRKVPEGGLVQVEM